MAPEPQSVTQVQTARKLREVEESPVVTLSARVVVSSVADMRVTARPIVASMADVHEENPRLEIHTVDGTSVGLEGSPLAELLREAQEFLKSGKEASRDHRGLSGLSASFDLSTGPFTVLEQPPFQVARATTLLHPSGNVALRLAGFDRVRKREEFHARRTKGEGTARPAFELQLTARKAQWLLSLVEESLRGVGAPP